MKSSWHSNGIRHIRQNVAWRQRIYSWTQHVTESANTSEACKVHFPVVTSTSSPTSPSLRFSLFPYQGKTGLSGHLLKIDCRLKNEPCKTGSIKVQRMMCFISITIVYSLENIAKGMKRQISEWKKDSEMTNLMKGLSSQMCQELSKVNNKK